VNRDGRVRETPGGFGDKKYKTYRGRRKANLSSKKPGFRMDKNRREGRGGKAIITNRD